METGEELQVEATLLDDILSLSISFGPEQMFEKRAGTTASERLLGAYRKLLAEAPEESRPRACVVTIKATTAGSPLVRALFELYKAVHAGGGQLFCVSYPDDYMDSLTSLGLTVLPGFAIASTIEEAVQKWRATGGNKG